MLDRPTLAISTGTGTVVGIGASKSVENVQSLLNSNLDQIIHGHFTWYGSDIAMVLGVLLSVAGIAVTIYRIRITKSIRDAL
ncbi:hypothetical protein IHC92_18270 [Photobacterium damselae subsp. damselae]|uniref:hypothetical protein n=1 Tax=Photobacterium damselae TaxID=38293 RepID=UPI001F291371|nr:hypothetical protein [Photobacterium damselae]UJZ95402.1 hypothetical protein IHC87_18280 [Photobacterium damselae subsp. damselae]UJZ99583.1 hypothetical protein IHC88_19210 [Photobacterium damselae subsp. damselae]UKA08690.1 hypothetical protein IHC90_16915 [Photobacterium damselae subsp. damselae]UKA11724.1 hypothetical protein IHC91_18245 [Photobacterium damselae subsp. damselae]UKA22916.1 hypothetical protein IHC92_18270 [Photobacterium damselae subsp. damselae]